MLNNNNNKENTMPIIFKKLDYEEIKKFSNLWSADKSIREICLYSSSHKKVFKDNNLIGFYFCDRQREYSVTNSWCMDRTTRYFIDKNLSQKFLLKPFRHQNKWIIEEINKHIGDIQCLN
jgi:hypothetical protein|tara:strand:+ start:87 stop:446 length:360 start_codon:yes stop_codon:yes gene_type:complete